MITQTYRRSSRLFSKFVEKHATKSVDEMVAWIKKQLDLIDNTGPGFYLVNGIAVNPAVNPEKESITIGIYSTVIYNEWHFPEKNDKIFEKNKFINTMICKLLELVDIHGKQWGSEWAIPMTIELLKINSNRFPQK